MTKIMGLVEDYKRKKALEKMPFMHVIQSTRGGVTMKMIRVVEITTGDRKQYYGQNNWITSVRYKFDESPYQMDIFDDETVGRSDGYASGCGDLWYHSTFITLSETEAKRVFAEETKRVYDKYLDPNRPPEPDYIPASA